MTKHLRFFMLTLLTIVCMVGQAQDETVWKSLSFPDDNKANNKCQGYATTWTAKIGDDSWSVSNFNNNNWSWTHIRCGRNNAASVASIMNDAAFTEAVTKVVVKISEAKYLNKVNSVNLIVAKDQACNDIVETVAGSFGEGTTFTGDLTFNVTAPAKNLFYKLVFDMQKSGVSKSGNGFIHVDAVGYYTGTSTPPTTTTFGDNSRKTFTFTNGKLEGFTAPTATATDGNTDLSNLIEYASSDADIVAVDSKTGELTFTNTKFGKAIITATLPKTDTYQTSTDSYVVVNKDNHIATSLSFNGTDVTLTEGKTDAGTDFTGYTATEASNIAGTITYAASGDAVATVNETTGAVTINAAVYGTTTITATFTPADPTQYSGSTATYKITNKKAVDLSEITFDVSEDNVSGTGKLTLTKSIVKIHTSNGALGKYSDYRFYKNSETTFSLTDPTRVITSIKFVGGSTYGKFTTDKPNYDKTTGTWTGYEESVIFTNTSTSRIDDITQIIVTTAEKKATPALSFAEATVTKELKEEIIEVQALTKPTDFDGTVTYKSDDDTVAEVVDNMIELKKTGEVTITATSAATDKYAAGTASYKLVIEDNRTPDADFKFAAESYSADLAEATDGIVTFNAANVLQNPNNLKVIYTISPKDENVDIDAPTGDVIISKRGTYTITATGAATGTYKETTATCTLKVTNSAVEEKNIEFVAGVDKGTGKDSDHAQNADEMHKSFVKINSDNAWFDSTQKDNYRFYKGTHTISTKIGKITKIEFVGNNIDNNNKVSNPLTKLSSTDNKYTSTDPNYGIWKGSAKEVVFTNGQQVRATNIIVTVEVPKAKNYTLDETKTDNVIETYENANVTLQRTLEASHWNSFCVPFALDKDQVTQYFGEGTQLRTYEGRCENNIVYFANVENIEAGKPYIMKPGNAVVQNPTFEGVSMVATGLDENGNPQAVGDASTVQMKGIYNHVTLVQDKTNIYIGAGNKFYYPADAEACQMNGLRAYFIVPEGTDIKKLRANLDGATTSLGEIFDTEESNTPVYNLQGQCVGNSLSTLKSGIYVQNGKKVVVK